MGIVVIGDVFIDIKGYSTSSYIEVFLLIFVHKKSYLLRMQSLHPKFR